MVKIKKNPKELSREYVFECINPDEYPIQPRGYSNHNRILWLEFVIRENKGVKDILHTFHIDDWLRGLPSCFAIEADDFLIQKILRKWNFIEKNDSEKIVARRVNQWWRLIANRIHECIGKAHKYDIEYRYEVQSRNNYHAIDLYKGDSCVTFIDSFKSKKKAESMAYYLQKAYNLGVKNAN